VREKALVEAGTVIAIVVIIAILGVGGFLVYRRMSHVRVYNRGNYGQSRKTTPEGEPLEDPRSYSAHGRRRLPGNVSMMVGIAIAAIILIVVFASSIKTVEAGNRGVLLSFGAVDTTRSLPEGLHIVTPFRDNVIPIEVRTLKAIESAASASKDLQDVRTEVALNYHVNADNAQIVYQQLGFDYASRVITPAIQESVKQVTARFNAEELVTKRETVKTEIEEQIKQRLSLYNIVVETMSITEFKFSEQFTRAVEAKVEAEQRALQAQNELRRITIEAQQAEAKAVGDQKANIARAEGLRQANILEAEGESEAIKIIDEQLRQSPSYLEWLKTQRWDGKLPLVVGEGGTPFIQIPTTSGEESKVE
jgi:regulator of protease activity HflC (stomatin/prohibitin superfamily)